MSQTEKYLNSILSKRLGSVINTGASSQNSNTVARIPLAQQPLEKMPTVFRKKYQTVVISQQSRMRDSLFKQMMQSQYEQADKEPIQSQRVQYMAISKRLTQKKKQDLISPTVDVNKYQSKFRKTATLSPQQIKSMQNIPQLQNRKSQEVYSDNEEMLGSAFRQRKRKIFG